MHPLNYLGYVLGTALYLVLGSAAIAHITGAPFPLVLHRLALGTLVAVAVLALFWFVGWLCNYTG